MVNGRQAQGVSFRLGLHEVKGSAVVEEYVCEACYTHTCIYTGNKRRGSFLVDLGHRADED